MNPITFPGLGLEFHINRVAFSVFGKPIYWYGIIIAVGFVLAVTYCYYNAARYGIQNILAGAVGSATLVVIFGFEHT